MKLEGTKNTIAIDATLMIMLTLHEWMDISPKVEKFMSNVIEAGIEAALVKQQAAILEPKEN